MLKTGTLLASRYEIVGRIGAGGMADVYKATDQKLNRNVAVKVMKPEFKSDSTFISKFRSEAQAAAGLANPNIVNVYDVGEDQGNYYIVMELVEGITLKEYIAKKGKLSVREATSIAIQVCMGLAAAHDQGIVHRDVKPQNIIISTDGKVKVTDFGIARAASSNTISANAMGSVHYSSPEQVRGGYSDTRSDIYSLGVTLYEMVTGRVPFDGETTVAIAIKHLQDEIEPPTKYTPDLPFALEQIIYKCTQKSVDRRYQSMNEVITDLKRSLMEPDGKFVQIAPLTDRSQTVMISKEDREAIRAGRLPENSAENVQQNTFSSIDAAKNGFEDDNDDDDQNDGDEDVGTGLEKAVTIGSFIVCGLIIAILVFFIARAAGLFRPQNRQTAPEPEVTSSESETPKVQIPNIVGMTEADAAKTAADKGLTLSYLGENFSDQAEGTIIEQTPAAGVAVEEGAALGYYKSKGPETQVVPSVAGQYVTDAEEALKKAGFANVTIEKESSSEVEIGNVISTSPADGEKVTPQTMITVNVSSGSADGGEVYVDDYTGVSEADAVAYAKSNGFIVRLAYDTSDMVGEDQVMEQSLEEGTMTDRGADLTLTINNASKMASAEESAAEAPEEAPAAAETATPAATETATPAAADSAAAAQTQSGTANAAPQTDSAAEPDAQITEAAGTAAAFTDSGWTGGGVLMAPSNYTGGAYRLVLVQTVNGAEQETVIEENLTALEFPYTLYTSGAPGVAEGTVYLYEQADGEYVPRAQWPVAFKED
ncbi:MAG: Stk1 family PASTA domain-containing Ser/Thr kinase [Lachnospiraceae bacterium]|nr:Stk1 family PASTA domain-containing Ser/Thr kinase [Lachnospiraceae bacterium]